MRLVPIFVLGAGLAFGGCSKSGSEPEAATDATSTGSGTGSASTSSGPNPGLSAALKTVDTDIEAKRYDAAIQKLLEAKIAAQQSEADQKLYEQKYRDAANALREKAETDPQARSSYETLGRAMMGR
jgi:hypothetical protein